MQFKSNICGNSKNICSPQGSVKHSSHFRDERPRRESGVTYSGSMASWCQSGCLSCCLTWRFSSTFHVDIHAVARHRFQCLLLRAESFRAGALFILLKWIRVEFPQSQVSSSAGGCQPEELGGSEDLLSDSASSWCLATGWILLK